MDSDPLDPSDCVPTGPDECDRAIEAILLSADEPVPGGLLAQLLEVSVPEIDARIAQLAAGYEVDGRGFIIARVAGGWRYQTHPDLASYVERFVVEGRSARLSAAAMETLAIVAYKQPISRAQIAAIRGVGVDSVMKSLEQREYICEIGRDPGPGQAVLFATTDRFLEKLGLDSLDALPPLSEFVPNQEIVDALDRGLRPEGEALPRARASGVSSGERQDRTEGVGDDASGDAMTSDTTNEDPLARLDATTARLDALVDAVRLKIESTEAALAEDEVVDDSEESDPKGPNGSAEADSPMKAEASGDIAFG